uniref:NR LBD domain-containing protein n=1 Tax=Panagrellus redivivus TaxID=6233 RepID=A0A7E4VU28_PANRE
MPYPIAKLPYGLRCRLTKLAVPLERYNLQIAAGNASICPPKLQRIRESMDNLHILCESGVITAYKTLISNEYTNQIDIGVDRLIRCKQDIVLRGFQVQDLKSDLFDTLLLETWNICMYECNLSKLFLEKLGALVQEHLLMSLRVKCFIETAEFEPFDFNDLLTFLKDMHPCASSSD